MARPQNVVDFVGKAAKTYNRKHTVLNSNHRHKMQKRLFICNLKDLFYLKAFIPKTSFGISMFQTFRRVFCVGDLCFLCENKRTLFYLKFPLFYFLTDFGGTFLMVILFCFFRSW